MLFDITVEKVSVEIVNGPALHRPMVYRSTLDPSPYHWLELPLSPIVFGLWGF